MYLIPCVSNEFLLKKLSPAVEVYLEPSTLIVQTEQLIGNRTGRRSFERWLISSLKPGKVSVWKKINQWSWKNLLPFRTRYNRCFVFEWNFKIVAIVELWYEIISCNWNWAINFGYIWIHRPRDARTVSSSGDKWVTLKIPNWNQRSEMLSFWTFRDHFWRWLLTVVQQQTVENFNLKWLSVHPYRWLLWLLSQRSLVHVCNDPPAVREDSSRWKFAIEVAWFQIWLFGHNKTPLDVAG